MIKNYDEWSRNQTIKKYNLVKFEEDFGEKMEVVVWISLEWWYCEDALSTEE